ncbi:glycoside hydrolase family 31 protein [Butyrivibrio sp. LC3010]|uniref:glycoside hydrolase family 31 protein n=1 Tax=Butyrivibrio sp. LC3010 TaxID=1280680 RepID=UPI000425A65E|nr:TIM-barrel domain-containing protein [Butyrivibrio sp. LC3010]
MMDVVPAKGRSISKVYEENDAVFMVSEAGVLRIIPQKGGIVRVSFSGDGSFNEEQGKDFLDYRGSLNYEILGDVTDENMEYISIKTDEGTVRVHKKSGVISFYDNKGQLLLSEDKKHPRELEKIPLFRTAKADRVQIEEVVTADGVKKRIKAADKEQYGEAYKTRIFFDFQENELLTGFGQGEHGEWNLRKRTYYVHQANKKIGIPMMVSSRKYGILLSTNSLFMFCEDEEKAYIQTEADHYLDYFFLFGKDLFDVVRNYRRITGKAAMLPMWAYGYIQSKERYCDQEEILKTAEEFRKRDIGVDCLVLDWMSWEDNKWGQKSFDKKRFPDPKAMIAGLHRKGIHFMMSIWPNMSAGTENNEEFKKKDLLFPGTDIYNAFSKEGRDLYWSQAQRALYPHGVDAWWCDSSEPITPEWTHLVEPSDGEKYYEYKQDASNMMPFELANAFGKYHAMTIWDGQRSSSLEKRVVNLTRSGWSGSQKYGTILWSGDIAASWNTLKNQVRAALQFASSGMPYWTLDAGAFFVKKGIQWFWNGDFSDGIDEAYKKLYVRWLEFAAYLPVFRAHGTDVDREPWAFGDRGDKYYEAICDTIKNRYKLLPYIYSIGAAAHFDDAMIIRPLMFDFASDGKAVDIADQFMFGDSLMICPVISESDRREVYLPSECDWYDFYTDEVFNGGQTIQYTSPLESIPVFVRAGAIIPTGKPAGCTEYMDGDDIEVVIYPGADTKFRLYEDAGDGYGYENGEYVITDFSWNDKDRNFSYESVGDMRFRKGKINYKIIH